MVCGTCKATIADKAIVCYRCGTPTAIPAVAARTRPPAAPRPWAIVVVLVVIAAVCGWLASAEPAGTAWQIVLAGFGVAALLGGVVLTLRRR
jgi:uncharacterized membrane protein HdeD (DUF308 family)